MRCPRRLGLRKMAAGENEKRDKYGMGEILQEEKMSRILPMLFNTEMTQLTAGGLKTATRRLVKPQPREFVQQRAGKPLEIWDGTGIYSIFTQDRRMITINAPCKKGDILYVRETWAFWPCIECEEEESCRKNPATHTDKDATTEGCYIYRADHPHPERITWRPSIHMPRAAARIWLGVTDVKIQRLQEMTLDDFLREGVVIRPEAFNDPDNAYMQARERFISVWNSTIPRWQQAIYGWDANPWVWAIEFEKCNKPDPCIIQGK